MSSTPVDTRLDCLVREAVANYGSYTATVDGLGDGRADRVLEINVDSDDLTHAYTREPFNKANKIPPHCRIRHFVYMIPIEERHGQEQRMLVGSTGDDLDVAMFFRPSAAATDTVYVSMPKLAFSDPGSQVQYAFRVRNYFEHLNGFLEQRDDIQIGMELTTTSQAKHPRRGVVLVTNNQLFSFQCSAMGQKHAGFKMQYNPLSLLTSESTCDLSVAELQTQVFGSIVQPLARAIERHYYTYTPRRAYGGGATRGGTTRGCGATKGGSSFSHASLVAGEEKCWNLSVSKSVPISKRERVKLSLMVGDIMQVFVSRLEHSSLPLAQPAVLFTPEDSTSSHNGYEDTIRCIETMRTEMVIHQRADKLALLVADMCKWPLDEGSEALAVGVREHADKDDEEGEDLSATFIGDGKREYTVQVGTLLRVRVTNMTLTDTCVEVHPFYCQATSQCGTCCFWEEADKVFSLRPGDSYEMPFPLQKDEGEGTDGWVLKDSNGTNVLTVLFKLQEELIDIPDEQDHVAFMALQSAREEDKMVVDPEVQAQAPTNGEKIHPECCICLETKNVCQMVTFVPCGHCACCENCYAKQVAADAAAGKRSTCPKCRQRVNSTIKVFF
jgi:hypothetical protein